MGNPIITQDLFFYREKYIPVDMNFCREVGSYTENILEIDECNGKFLKMDADQNKNVTR